MKRKILFRICVPLIKALALIFLTAGISAVSRVIFLDNMEQGFLEDHTLNVLYMVLFLLVFSSLTVALHSHDKYVTERFSASAESKNSTSAIKFTITSLEFYLELVCIAVVSLVLPSGSLYGFVGKAFFYNADITDFQIKIYTLLIMLPLLFFIDFFARAGIAKKRYFRSRKKQSGFESEKERIILPTIKDVILTALIYCAASLVFPWYLPSLVSLCRMGGAVVFLRILLCIISAVAIFIVSFYIRAVFKRRDFVTKLKNL